MAVGYCATQVKGCSVMTEIDTLTYGKQNTYTFSSYHILRESINEFLTTESTLSLLSTVIKLSIGVEILIKESLTEIDPRLIDKESFNWKLWKRIKPDLPISRVQQRSYVERVRRFKI